VWHTLQGYWQGTSADGPLKKFYQIVRNSKKSSKFEGWPDQFDADTRDLVHPTDIQRFYQDFYRYLRSCGIDMTKVDNQAMLQDFTEGILPQVQTQVSYQEALQGASAHHFNGNLLHCMCNTSDIGFHMSSANLWRNSDDFYPKKNSDAQARHIHSNAFNNVFSQTFSIPDWDMFQTYHATGAYHAAARSISGGPIYVSDKPGKQNFALLKKLCLDDGRVLRCPQPALPSEDRLFTNCLKESKLLKITNRNGDHGVLGLFHCQNKEFRSTESITNTFAPSDIPYLRGKEFACFLHNQDEYICLSTRTKKSLTLNPLEFELATFAPIEQGVAVFGLLDKYNSSAAILQSGWQSSQEYSIQLIAGGEIGIYSEMRPKSIRANGRPIKFKYNKKQRRLTIRKRTPKTLTIQMRF
ncbi:MAG: Sip1-related alpha-galactosidase, partial [Verrucomicrobiota bacterium]